MSSGGFTASDINVDVICGNKRKKSCLKFGGFESLKNEMRERFNLTGDILTMTATVRDNEELEYDIEDDDELIAIWGNMTCLRVFPFTAKEREEKMKVIVDEGIQYSLLKRPTKDSPIVQNESKRLDIKFRDYTTQTKDSVLLARNIAVASGNANFIAETNNVAKSSVKICQRSKVLMYAYRTTSENILDTFEHTIIDLVENRSREAAMMTFADLRGVSKTVYDDTASLVEDIEKDMKKIEKFQESIERNLSEASSEAQKLDEKKLRVEKLLNDCLEKQSDIGTDIDKTSNKKERDKRKVSAVGGVFSGIGVAGGVGAGIALAVGAPTFLIAAPLAIATASVGSVIGTLAYEAKTGSNNEKLLQRQTSERDETEEATNALIDDLTQVNLDLATWKELSTCMTHILAPINLLKAVLEEMKSNWNEMFIFCKGIQSSEDTLQKRMRDSFQNFDLPSHRLQVLKYYAKWVALREFFNDLRNDLEVEASRLSECAERNISREDAEEYILVDVHLRGKTTRHCVKTGEGKQCTGNP